MPLFQRQRHVRHLDARIAGLDGRGQGQRILQRAAPRRVHDVGIEPLVDFMVP